MKPYIYSLTLAATCSSLVYAAPIKDHSDYALKDTIWNTSLVDFQKNLSHLKFKWQTNEKVSLRSAVPFKIFGLQSGETLITGKDGNVNRVTFSVFNRGDHGNLSSKELSRRFDLIKTALNDATGKEHKDMSKKGAVQLTSYLWKTDATAFLLEKSSSGDTAEFLRLKTAPMKDAGKGNRTASRSGLKQNVVEDDNGDVYIKGIPMVDQGPKGYCACASSARIFQYYGRDLSMHEVAQMAGSGNQGTQISSMVDAFKKAAGKLNSRVVILYEYPKYMSKTDVTQSQLKSSYRESASDVNKYQQLAKKKKGKLLNINGKEGGKVPSGAMISIFSVQPQMDPEIYKEFMIKKSNYSRFKSSIKKYIKEGVPVGWCLQLGMFKEDGLPQTGGGHMRLIIGYNEEKNTIIYSDSWGAGHAKKSMPLDHAYCMTNVLLAMPPTR